MPTIEYAQGNMPLDYIYRATNGGTVLSTNLVDETAFDYFEDSAVADDAIYFGWSRNPGGSRSASRIILNIGTALSGDVEIVWEVHQLSHIDADGNSVSTGWHEIKSFEDETEGFTQTGVKAFKFGLPYRWDNLTTDAFFPTDRPNMIRARLKTVTSITEGGANATDKVGAKDANVKITGYTEGSPCSFTAVYNWLKANAPWLGVKRDAIRFDFKEIVFSIESPLHSTNEIVEMGYAHRDGPRFNGSWNLSGLKMGIKIDENTGRDGGSLIFHQATNSYSGSSPGALYGCHIIGVLGWGYPTWNMETLSCYINNVSWRPNEAGIIKNTSHFSNAFWLGTAAFFGEFDNNFCYFGGGYGYYVYSSDIRMTNINFILDVNGWFYLYNTVRPITIEVINPVGQMPSQLSSPLMFTKVNRSQVGDWDRVWFYDASEDSYTDLTAVCNSTDADTMPIHGDVGDRYLFGTSVSSIPHLKIFTNLTSNDYEYEFTYNGFDDRETRTVDTSANFTKSEHHDTMEGRIYPLVNEQVTFASRTINGVSSRYISMKIVSKGTGTPHVTRIAQTGLTETGNTNWIGKERYTFDISVRDILGNPLEGANVDLKYNETDIFSEDTDAQGKIEQQIIDYRTWYLDPLNYGMNPGGVAEITRDEQYTMRISKAGYETYTAKIVIDEKKDFQVELKKAIQVMTSNKGPAIKANPENAGDNRDLLIMP